MVPRTEGPLAFRLGFLPAGIPGGILAALVAGLLAGSQPAHAGPPQPRTHDGGFFRIDVPQNWDVITAGQCSGFAFLLRDPAQPLRQVFFFGEIGPFYLSGDQQAIDRQYVQNGGYPIAWIDMPVVEPLTPAGLLRCFEQIAATRIAQEFMPQAPQLSSFRTVSESAGASPIQGGVSHVVRGLFLDRGRVAEGLFSATVAPWMPHTGGPGGGTGCALLVTGITAPKEEFVDWQPLLARCLESFTIEPGYVSNCLQQQAAAYGAIQRAGRVLDETADLIVDGWQERNRSDDILSQQRSDAILGRDRVYDPDTGEVYDVDPNFYQDYEIHRGRYEMNNLQRLPAHDYDLWMSVPRPGDRHIR